MNRPRKPQTERVHTPAELLAAYDEAKDLFEAKLAAYHNMPCTLTETERRSAFAGQERAYAEAQASGAFL